MHILQVTKYFYPAVSFGGPVQCTYNLSKYLVSRGHRVTVFTTDALDISSNTRIKEKHQLLEGIDVYYFRNISRFYGFFVSPEIIPTLQRDITNFDVVHLHEYRTFQNLIFHFINMKRVPYVLSCHGEYACINESLDQLLLRRFFEKTFGKRIVNDANKLLALTQFEKNQYLVGGVEKTKIEVIPNGVASQDFSVDVTERSYTSLSNSDQEKIILYLGRIHKDKGIDVLLKAFALLLQGGFHVRLVLSGPDDGFLDTLKKIAKKLDVAKNVYFTGPLNRKQVIAAYKSANVVVYTSIQEGFPLVPLEAGMAGKPVIVSDIPAMDYVQKGKFGLIVSYGDITQLKEALESILNDEELSNELGENGRKFVTENYDWQVIGKRIEEIYYEVSQAR